MKRAAKTAAVFGLAAVAAGCGGGGDAADQTPQTLVDQVTTVDRVVPPTQQASGFFETLAGPAFSVPSARGYVRACYDLQWSQAVTKAVGLSLWLKPTQPVDSAPVTTTTAAPGAGTTTAAQQRCVEYRPTSTGGAGLEVQARITTDCACADALRDYSIRVRWSAVFYPE